MERRNVEGGWELNMLVKQNEASAGRGWSEAGRTWEESGQGAGHVATCRPEQGMEFILSVMGSTWKTLSKEEI